MSFSLHTKQRGTSGCRVRHWPFLNRVNATKVSIADTDHVLTSGGIIIHYFKTIGL